MAPPSLQKPASCRKKPTNTTMNVVESDPSQVRVCVRVRPITAKEQQNGISTVLDVSNTNVVQLSGRRFTFDSVFDADTSQIELYQHVAPSLMQSFLDGFNATIIAYGQTGSGKTYTMGSEAHTELELMPSTGLIPRFLQDLFDQLPTENFTLEATFLEVYGDDIHDLLDLSRTVLPLREDSGGGVVCSGLTVRKIESAIEAVQVLHEGTINRSTAATLMNQTSSRSHAVFTVYLKRQNISSKLTFVDLAGSERMKKTGTEGERAREGIQINMGLLALGNVINALADDERLQNGAKKIHVPYRQSKLTRLLQDALGGNSKTVFLACISSTDQNVSETLSTLHYANRARNIQNAPTRNIDFPTEPNHQLRAYIHVLETELIGMKFGNLATNVESPIVKISDGLMQRHDVLNYLEKLRLLSNEAQPCQLSVRTESPSDEGTLKEFTLPMIKDANQSVMETFDSTLLADVNPDEELAILDQLLELQQQDQEFHREQKQDIEDLKDVEGELVEKEQLLLHLRDSLKIYHNMKEKYETLIVEVQNLEREKVELAEQLEKASKDPALGCSKAIKKEIEAVERSLARARTETRKHREMYMKAEHEAQKCRALESKILELKQGRANLIKKQREAAARHREMTESKTKEIMALKRKDRNATRKLSKLETEIQTHKRNLYNRQIYCKKLIEQKKKTESHLLKLLSLRQRHLRERTNPTSRRDKGFEDAFVQKPDICHGSLLESSEEIESTILLLEKAVSELVLNLELQCQYQSRLATYSELMRTLAVAVKDLEDSNAEDRHESLHTIRELELKIELAEADLEKVGAQMSRTVTDNGAVFDSLPQQLLLEKSAPTLCTIIVEFMKKLAAVEIQRRQVATTLNAKENVVKCFDAEVDSLHSTIDALKRELLRRPSTGNKNDSNDDIGNDQHLHRKLKQELEVLQQENSLFGLICDDLASDYEKVALALNVAKEKLAVYEVSLKQKNEFLPPLEKIEMIHTIWEELGLAPTIREELFSRIENCLELACAKLLDDAQALKQSTIEEISEVQEEISQINSSLALIPTECASSSSPLLEQLEALRVQKSHLKPLIQDAVIRRDAIAEKASNLSFTLGIPTESLNEHLIILLDVVANSKKSFKEGKFNGSGDISEDFLSHCENAVHELQLQKSKILITNSTMQSEILAMASDMNVKENEIISLVSSIVKRRFSTLPTWWNNEVFDMVSRSVSKIGGVIRTSQQFSQHLVIIHESLSCVANVRRQVSCKLRSIIEHAQHTLLKTVDGEFDANSEYSNFHEELFRLPPLSMEFIQTCFTEIEALCAGVDIMSQSEIEALTVVCEALNISTVNRGFFWDSMDQLRDTGTQPIGPFDDIIALSAADTEEWLRSAVKNGTKSYIELSARLVTLENIHSEVEQLREMQDSKSKIISLDTEVRILCAQLKEFEDKKCIKQRLTTKKITSSILLREERFRKQMQSKFTSKLAQLVSMLKTWKSSEDSVFDQDLLSDEVISILKNSDRNEFMHLRTVEYKSLSKRSADDHRSVSRNPSPPSKRLRMAKQETVIQVPSKALTVISNRRNVDRINDHVLPPGGDNNEKEVTLTVKSKRNTGASTISSLTATSDSTKRPLKKKKKLVLDPFGNVLAQAMSPHVQSNKENEQT